MPVTNDSTVTAMGHERRRTRPTRRRAGDVSDRGVEHRPHGLAELLRLSASGRL